MKILFCIGLGCSVGDLYLFRWVEKKQKGAIERNLFTKNKVVVGSDYFFAYLQVAIMCHRKSEYNRDENSVTYCVSVTITNWNGDIISI